MSCVMIELIIFLKSSNDSVERLFAKIEDIILIIAKNYKEFLLSVSAENMNTRVVLLYIDNEYDLTYVNYLNKLLINTKIIVVLTVKRVEMVNVALALNPTLLLFMNENQEQHCLNAGKDGRLARIGSWSIKF